jgi:hypothetical protein
MQKLITKYQPSEPGTTTAIAQIAQAYIEIISGLRRPEQLARWLSESAYYDLCQRSAREHRSRQLLGVRQRPVISIRKTQLFATDSRALMAVVLVDISGVVRALSVRVEAVNGRPRIVDLILI